MSVSLKQLRILKKIYNIKIPTNKHPAMVSGIEPSAIPPGVAKVNIRPVIKQQLKVVSNIHPIASSTLSYIFVYKFLYYISIFN
jgi:hypothetical protein